MKFFHTEVSQDIFLCLMKTRSTVVPNMQYLS